MLSKTGLVQGALQGLEVAVAGDGGFAGDEDGRSANVGGQGADGFGGVRRQLVADGQHVGWDGLSRGLCGQRASLAAHFDVPRCLSPVRVVTV